MAPLTPPANPPKDSSAPHPGGDFGTPLVSRGNNDDPDDSEDDESFLPSLQAAASERVPGTLGMFLYSLFSRKSARNGKISARETSSAYFAYVKVLVRQQPISAVFMFITLGALAVAYATLPVFINLAFRIVYLSPGVRGVSLDKFAQWVGLYSLCIFICATVFERTFLYARAGLMRDVSLLALQFSEMDDDVSDEQLEGFLTTDADEFRRFAHHAHQLVLFSTAAGACFLSLASGGSATRLGAPPVRVRLPGNRRRVRRGVLCPENRRGRYASTTSGINRQGAYGKAGNHGSPRERSNSNRLQTARVAKLADA